ncbi:hypothetical protein [Cerasicoccus fimbriatus]|uniref:hypothetical protein n=1 Tax=Cerasicoccus fimbriatus TaxID=3014554 RepID=UPI0022B4CF68|nr:hypothetical protein [Cerasicoccus sp. TK19100]
MKSIFLSSLILLPLASYATNINDGIIRFDDPTTVGTQGVDFKFYDLYEFHDIDDGIYDDDPSEMYFLSDQREIKWIWGHEYNDGVTPATYVPQMELTENGALLLYDREDISSPMIEINPVSGKIYIDNSEVLLLKGSGPTSTGFAYGSFSEASGSYSLAFGYRAKSLANYSFAFGRFAEANAQNAFAVGGYANALNSIAFSGGITDAQARNSMAVGGVTVLGESSFAFGSQWANRPYDEDYTISMEIDGDYTFAFGTAIRTSSNHSFAFGERVRTAGLHSMVFGLGSDTGGFTHDPQGHEANGDFSLAFGEMNLVDGDHAHALGQNLTVSSMHTTVIGRYNRNLQADGLTPAGNPDTWNSADPLFEIGNGDSSTPSNAMTVYKSGDVEMSENLHVAGKITLAAPAGDISMGVFGAQ